MCKAPRLDSIPGWPIGAFASLVRGEDAIWAVPALPLLARSIESKVRNQAPPVFIHFQQETESAGIS